jgi:hypothetical protein
MASSKRLTVEFNGQQLKLIQILQSASYPEIDVSEVVRLGFNEWVKLKRARLA